MSSDLFWGFRYDGWAEFLELASSLLSSGRLIDILEHEIFKSREGGRFFFASGIFHANSAWMNSNTDPTVRRKHFDWREDLASSRDLSKREFDAYGSYFRGSRTGE